MNSRRVFKLAVVPLLVLCLGLHWALLQTVAWTGMLIRYSQDRPLAEAVSDTFDGQHPCPMCEVIEQGREDERQEREQYPSKSGPKMDWAIIWESSSFHFLEKREEFATVGCSRGLRTRTPPTPPPRAFSS